MLLVFQSTYELTSDEDKSCSSKDGSGQVSTSSLEKTGERGMVVRGRHMDVVVVRDGMLVR